jgi:4-hydroxy-4-methyl-2-oxoglutarate aldolase
VVDNGGRNDEACIGDLTALEAGSAGVTGMVVWGLHRDTVHLRKIGMPVFSYGSLSFGPRRVDPRDPDARTTARFGEFSVSRDDVVFADDDGVVFVAASDLADLLPIA